MADNIPYYEYIVAGLGGVGSGTLYWLSKKAGKNVLGLEQFKLGHENGGSQDVSRMIRMEYPEEDYTKLTPFTFEAWEDLERESGIKVFHRTGSMVLGRKNTPGETCVNAFARAMSAQNIPFERLDGRQIRNRFPQMTFDNDDVALYNKYGGLVDAALASALHVQLARGNGACVLEECGVQRVVTNDDDTATVYTTKGPFRCRRLIVTAGSWVNQILESVGVHIPMVVTQEQVTYLGTPRPKMFTKENFPVFFYYCNEEDGHDYYVLPIHSNSGFKIGIDRTGPQVTPDTRDYVPDPVRVEKAIAFLRKNVPDSVGPVLFSKTCLTAMTLDRKFVIDDLARQGKQQIIFCCGAGHAYKWAALFGKILSEMATEGWTPYNISGFTMDREAVKDPNFIPVFSLAKCSPSPAKL